MSHDRAERKQDQAPTPPVHEARLPESNERRPSNPPPPDGLFAPLGDQLETAGTRDPTSLRGRHDAPKRVADATDEANAVLKVVAYRNGQILKTLSVNAAWDMRLPYESRAVRASSASKWMWSDWDAEKVTVRASAQAPEQTLAAWAGATADEIKVYARAKTEVQSRRDVDVKNDHAPGKTNDKKNDPSKIGATASKGKPAGDRHGGQQGGKQGGSGSEDRKSDAERAFRERLLRGIFGSQKNDNENGKDDGTERRRENGSEHGKDHGTEHGKDTGSERGSEQGKPKGHDGGKDGGSEHGKLNGRPGGERAGSKDGAVGGSRDGKKGGDTEGMYGGEGEKGDRGVPSAVGLFGGLISVPAQLRGLTELALIVSNANVTGAGEQAFKSQLKLTFRRFGGVAGIRSKIAREATAVAEQNAKHVIKKLATDPSTKAAWKALRKEQQDQIHRIVEWELQRKYFAGYQRAAAAATSNAKQALKAQPRSKVWRQRLADSEMAERAAQVKPVAGRMPINSEYAGMQFPAERLPKKYRDKGVKFTKEGYPDFDPHAMTLPNKQRSVMIKYQGTRTADFKEADRLAGFSKTNPRPANATWHHVEDPLGKMILVPTPLHDAVKHTGGVATWKHSTGDVTKYAGEE